MPGPAPKDPSLRRRRNASIGKTFLPAGGRRGEVPDWPLTASKPSVWVELWSTPQAAVWERHGWTRTVARYALLLEVAESAEASTALLAEVRQLEDRLGLNPKSMRALLWEVTEDEVAEVRDRPAKAVSKRVQLRVVG